MNGFLAVPCRPHGDFTNNNNNNNNMEEVFRSITDSLRTQHDREGGFEARVMHNRTSPFRGGGETAALLRERTVSVVCPSLSLRHEGHLNMNRNSRLQAQSEAASLLARTVRVELDPDDRTANAAEDGLIRMDDLPPVLMNNMYGSFAVLVDSRLHVYSKVILRHLRSLVTKGADAFGILQVGQKLETLHDIGGQITAESMDFHVDLEDQDIEEVSPGVFQQAIRLEATMELRVPSPGGSHRILAVRHTGQGFLEGTVRDSDRKIHVSLEIDSKDLLHSMMDQASLMVAQIVESTNEAFCAPEPKLQRGASFFVMPPPSPRKKPAASAGLDLVSQAAAAAGDAEDSAVITPDLGSKKTDCSLIPPFHLHDEDKETADDANVDDLSVDQCASIIDDVFGDMDGALLLGPPTKKIRES